MKEGRKLFCRLITEIKVAVASFLAVLEGGQCQRRWMSRQSAGDQVKAYYKHLVQITDVSLVPNTLGHHQSLSTFLLL